MRDRWNHYCNNEAVSNPQYGDYPPDRYTASEAGESSDPGDILEGDVIMPDGWSTGDSFPWVTISASSDSTAEFIPGRFNGLTWAEWLASVDVNPTGVYTAYSIQCWNVYSGGYGSAHPGAGSFGFGDVGNSWFVFTTVDPVPPESFRDEVAAQIDLGNPVPRTAPPNKGTWSSTSSRTCGSPAVTCLRAVSM